MTLFLAQRYTESVYKILNEVQSIISLQTQIPEEFEEGSIPRSVLRTAQLGLSQLIRDKMNSEFTSLMLQQSIEKLQDCYISLTKSLPPKVNITHDNVLQVFPTIQVDSEISRTYMDIRNQVEKSLKELRELKQRYLFYKENEKLTHSISDNQYESHINISTNLQQTYDVLNEMIQKIEQDALKPKENTTTYSQKRLDTSEIFNSYYSKKVH